MRARHLIKAFAVSACAFTLLAPGWASAGASVVATIPATGGTPFASEYNPANGRIYQSLYGSGSVQVIDATTNTTIGTPIAVGACPWDIDANAATNRVYVANVCSGTISVIDGATSAVIATVPTFGDYDGMVVDEAANRVYVGGYAPSIRVIDGATNALLPSIPVPLDFHLGMSIDQATGRLFIPSYSTSSILVSNGISVIGSVPLPTSPVQSLVDAANGRLIVAGYGALALVTLDLTTLAPTGPSLPPPPGFAPEFGVAMNRVTGRVYVPTPYAGTVEVYDGTPLAPIGSVSTSGLYPVGPSVAPDRWRLYQPVCCGSPDRMLVITEDDVGSSAAFTTPSGSVLRNLVVIQDAVTGTATDDYSGVDAVTVTFTHSLTGMVDTLAATVTCGSARRLSCTWSAVPPLVPGPYNVSLPAQTDRAGATGAAGGSIAITVV